MTLRAQRTRTVRVKQTRALLIRDKLGDALLIKKKNFYEKIIFIKTTSVKYRK